MDPYLEGDDWTSFHTQSCLRNIYDLGGFDLVLDYSKAPAVPIRELV